MVLDETRTAGESGHLSDHNSLHDFYNAAVTAGVFDEATGTYKDTSPTEVWLGEEVWKLNSGTPSSSFINARLPAWSFDDGGTHLISGNFRLPPGWSTFDIELWWSNAGTGTGAVVWGGVYGLVADGEQAATEQVTYNPGTAYTAPSQSIMEVTTLASGIAVAAASIGFIRLDRFGADAADTLANAALAAGVMLKKAS